VLKRTLAVAILAFALGVGVGKGWIPPNSSQGTAGSLIGAPSKASTSNPSYSHLQLINGQYGELGGSITLRNNADSPLTVMATITLYNGSQTVGTLFARADRVLAGTQQKVAINGSPAVSYNKVAVDLEAVP
jgi:hypothetical protein